MDRIEKRLLASGYTVANIDYPSRRMKIEELSETAVDKGLAICREKGSRHIHFVTHSLGGILVRYYLAFTGIPELGRVVMLAPPNQGSGVAEKFSDFPGYELLNGPAGNQLGKDGRSIPLRLGPADFELGVISGDRTVNPLLSTAYDEPNDGKVSVEETRLQGMNDFLVVHHSHPFIMRSEDVIDQVLHFLEKGYFQD